MLYCIPIVGGACFKGFKFLSLIVSYVIGFLSISIAQTLVGSPLHIHTVCYGLVFLLSSHELERMSRMSFLFYDKEKRATFAQNEKVLSIYVLASFNFTLSV